MYAILLTVHVAVCVLIVLVVLIQAGRSGGLSGFMGSGGGDALFSTSSQQSGIRKFTVILAILFFFTSFGLTVLVSRTPRTVLGRQYPALPPVQQQGNPQQIPNTGQMPADTAPSHQNQAAPAPQKGTK